ncbi:MAG: carotenoid 1,2-hydratase [Meiothermus sp.]|uniref:lipocalin family protein n=1 Tax=Meiothermus sp. TaxID=1955249 RepID=UPI0025DA940F|nr:lipocalin family protein [Meiothermus sp.]MCS7058867.1 carotenoid 1,2-hydratase [Meiothermus sp.]MCS7194907.1 carotenoid 1,2-hydratase [Meiothermus sp.]MDW8091284.1 lipocalin family protein [Meiothermus sp.]
MRRWMLALLLLTGCLPALQGVDPERLPSPDSWGPHNAPLEWWYVSAYLPEAGLAFHWAFFKAYVPQNWRLGPLPPALLFPGPYHASHIAITDLRADQKRFEERFDFRFDRPFGDSRVVYPPLLIEQGDWRLRQEGNSFWLTAGPIQVRLVPLKPAVVHPPGYSGTAETGRMYYVSFTRMALEGTILGRPVRGEAWMDHQWGDQLGSEEGNPTALGALWDWFGLHLSDGSDLMLYRVRNRKGEVVQLAGSATDPQGRVEAVRDLRMTPLERWTSPSGRSYALAWQVEGEGLSLRLEPLRKDQELLTASTRVAYWEGPVVGSGTWRGTPVLARGMGEFVAGPYEPPGGLFR